MAKSKKFKKIVKTIVIITLIIAVTAVGFGVTTYFVLTADAKLNTSSLKPSSSAVTILDSEGAEINSYTGVTDETEINSHTINAFIAKEDKRFYTHSGVDYIRIVGALKNNIINGEIVEGGSTITQQLVKNTQLSQEKTLKRKLKEVKLSRELEEIYSKEEILDIYLNSIYFGNNLFGIRSASSFYFGKQVKDLSIAESAILSGLISAPSVYNPVADLETCKSKAKMVINLMHEQEFITDTERTLAITELENFKPTKKDNIGALYLSFVTREVCDILGVEKLPNSAKIEIKTYLNKSLQKQMDEMALSEAYKANDAGGTMSGIGSIVLDNKTGGVIAFSGDSNFNLLDLKRQPASTIKPLLVYGPALEKNLISPASFILDEPINIDGYAPQNATKVCYGYTTVRDNIVRSTNIPAVKILNQTGIDYSKSFASKLGIPFDPEDNNLAIALGGFNSGVTIKDLATAYMALARGGNYLKTTFVKEIKINDFVVYQNKNLGTQVMKDSTAYLLTDMLKSVASYGTGRNINSLGLPIASKTGTNAINGINHDAWNVSYTTEHTAVCWMGNLGPLSETSSNQYNGSLYATYFVRDIFKNLYSSYSPDDFKRPSSVTTVKLDRKSYENHTLFQASDSSLDYLTELFASDNLPPKIDPSIEGLNLLEELTIKTNPTPTQIDYTRFIRKYGLW